jgi:hypothetical protein
MSLRELIEVLQSIEKEIGSHPGIDGRVSIDTEDHSYHIESVEPLMAVGCGCWYGAQINIKRGE